MKENINKTTNFNSYDNDLKLGSLIKGEKVLFISTKNADYIRNQQEINIIKQYSSQCTLIVYTDKHYIVRLAKVYWSLIHFLLKDKDTTIVLAGFSPQLVYPLLSLLKKQRTLILDFFISLYDTFVWDRKTLKSKSPLARFMFWLDQATILKADYFLADTKQHLNYFVSEFEASPNKGIVLYLEADTAVFKPLAIPKPKPYKDKFIVLFYGSILPLHGVETILKAMKLLEDHEEIQCLLIGRKLNKELRTLYDQTKNVHLLEWMNSQDLMNHIAFSDINLIGHFSSESSKAFRTIPGRAYIAAQADKVMILGDNSANRELFEETDKCYFVKMGDPIALKKCIETIYYNQKAKS